MRNLPYTACAVCAIPTTTLPPFPCDFALKLPFPPRNCPRLMLKHDGLYYPCAEHMPVELLRAYRGLSRDLKEVVASQAGLERDITAECEKKVSKKERKRVRFELQILEIRRARIEELERQRMEIAEWALWQSLRPWPREEEDEDEEVEEMEGKDF
ncbi:MAG: hypothetical protein M1828_004471 [Chrysothrix sp. TS-e1954]|nr:MAG: hypothetical protein M1828_004471 [Chrysothrix sp. TS-e1954]